MPNLYTVPAGESIARHAAGFALTQFSSQDLSRTVMFVPTRRSAVVLRDAFQKQLDGKAALLPRMIPLAEIGNELLLLLGDHAFEIMATIPPAMPEAQHRYLLAQQIAAFERKRLEASGIKSAPVSLTYALTLTDTLMALQEQCARSGVTITQEKLRQLVHSDYATHWQQALLFLGILTDNWPELERELGLTTQAAREVALLNAVTEHWQHTPPDFPIIVVGSTASQHTTAMLLKTIADLEEGHVILPGLDPTMPPHEWQSIAIGHPLYHLKHFLNLWPISPDQIQSLANTDRSIWMNTLSATDHIPNWAFIAKPNASNIRLVPCAHPEEEARVISLLLRESLEQSNHLTALITPDEGLMNRVAAHMKRYGITVDRLNAGSLANTETGSLWAALLTAIAEPEQLLLIRSLIHHPSLNINPALLSSLEKGWHGVNRRRAGQLPLHDAALHNHPSYFQIADFVKQIAYLSRKQMTPSQWVETCKKLLNAFLEQSGQGHDAVEDALETLSHADLFGTMDAIDFTALLTHALNSPWRDAGISTHPQIAMLTPVEARLQCFDRVILANMQEQIWPGITSPNPWLNLAAQQTLGLPAPEERISLMAHDILMLGSSGEVFFTYPKRDQGSPTTRSRFIERLVTMLAMHGTGEATLHAPHYIAWANARDAAENYSPEQPIRPTPPREQRPQKLPVSTLDRLFTDPFSIYAEQVLGLRKLEDIDAAPEASDFGSITHRAIEVLTQYWNEHLRPATEKEITDIADHALRDFSERPNVALFWRTRLVNGLHYINTLEEGRRTTQPEVKSEQSIEAAISLGQDLSIMLHGRIDRLELGKEGATVIDYKTGDIPSKKKILDGRALQLLAYAMLLNQQNTLTNAIEYWALPRIGREGETLAVDLQSETIETIETKLHDALRQMLDAEMPFLARPISTNADDRFGNDYDGISRYDEWAG